MNSSIHSSKSVCCVRNNGKKSAVRGHGHIFIYIYLNKFDKFEIENKTKNNNNSIFRMSLPFNINFSAVFAKLLFSKLLNLQALKDEQAIGWTSEFRFEIISGYIELDVFLYN